MVGPSAPSTAAASTAASSRAASSRAPFPWGAVVAGLATLAALYLVFWHAPREQQMGHVYRIFFFHVASAMASLVLFLGCAILSGGFLGLRGRKGYLVMALKAERLAFAAGEIGVLFGVIVLVTGPLWAKPAWGTYWTWEPRLTLTLLTWFLFVGYLVMRNYAGSDDMGRRLAAGIALVGAPATYLIHVAVRLWGGNHPTVVTQGGGGLSSPEMQLTFGVTIAAMALFVGYLVHARYRRHALRDLLDDLHLDLTDLEDAR